VKRVSRYQLNYFAATEAADGNVVDGMSMPNNGATVLVVSNDSGAPQTLELTIVETVDFSPASPVSITVASDAWTGVLGPFPREFYGNVLEFSVSSVDVTFVGFSLL